MDEVEIVAELNFIERKLRELNVRKNFLLAELDDIRKPFELRREYRLPADWSHLFQRQRNVEDDENDVYWNMDDE
jgi:hypothetical protein